MTTDLLPEDDDREWYDVLRDERRERHAAWHVTNMQVLQNAASRGDVTFTVRETAVLFREPGKPKVDFYPGTGRWRIPGRPAKETFRGGALAFLVWYVKQEVR